MTRPTRPGSIRAEGLTKAYGGQRVLDGIDLRVAPGSVHALLGPNGAGKTTTVRILATLLRPDTGHARIAGHDLLTAPEAVRRSIGLCGQYASVDEHLTGRENLRLLGRLHGLPGRPAARRADELLDRFGLSSFGGRRAGRYSGGMRRRLDLACALVAHPSVVILDEPTTGLDPRGRGEAFRAIRELLRDGVAILLTTQYLEEADQLADEITVVDRGSVVALGSPASLKRILPGQRVELTVDHRDHLPVLAEMLTRACDETAEVDDRNLRVRITTDDAPGTVGQVMAEATDKGIGVAELVAHPRGLDDVFLHLTAPDRDGRP